MAERVESHAGRPEESVVGVIGGTGELGRGLAKRWAAAGVSVLLGSRDARRAEAVAATFAGDVRGVSNATAVADADTVVLAVPWSACDSTVDEHRTALVERLVVSCVNPLGFDERGPFALDVPGGSAVEHVSALLPASTVVGAFHHIPASLLLDSTVDTVDCDVLVVGDDRSAVERVIALADAIPGVRGVYSGRQRNARQVEALTANLIAVNRRYRARSGVRITGVFD